MKILTVICCCLLLAACAPQINGSKVTDQSEPTIPFDQQLFIDGVNQLLRQQDPESLLELKNNFPGSPWTEQAGAILSMRDQLDRQKRELAQLQQQLAEPAPDQSLKLTETQLTQCTLENERLQQEIDTLNKKLEALRELTIELELK